MEGKKFINSKEGTYIITPYPLLTTTDYTNQVHNLILMYNTIPYFCIRLI